MPTKREVDHLISIEKELHDKIDEDYESFMSKTYLPRLFYKATERRSRYPHPKGQMHRRGELIRIPGSYQERYNCSTQVVILYCYYTKNDVWMNLHKRVMILDGPNEGKFISTS